MKNDIETKFHNFVINYVKKMFNDGERFQILSQHEQQDLPKEFGGTCQISLIHKMVFEAKLGKLYVLCLKEHPWLTEEALKEHNINYNKNIKVLSASFCDEGLSNETIFELEKLINDYESKTYEKEQKPREERLLQIMEENS